MLNFYVSSTSLNLNSTTLIEDAPSRRLINLLEKYTVDLSFEKSSFAISSELIELPTHENQS